MALLAFHACRQVGVIESRGWAGHTSPLVRQNSTWLALQASFLVAAGRAVLSTRGATPDKEVVESTNGACLTLARFGKPET